MSEFQETVRADIDGIFLNLDEFAEVRQVRYDAQNYNLKLIMQRNKTEVRDDDRMQGIYTRTHTVWFAEADLIPEQGKLIEISDGEALGEPFMRRYRIVTSDVEVGMVRLELEVSDE